MAFKPLNQEPPATDLISSPITSLKNSYHRNHGPIPHLSGEKHTITISDTTTPPLLTSRRTISISDLHALPQTRITCALQCAGNRRHTMRTKIKEVQGIDWRDGAVMNAIWTGVRLVDLLINILGKDIESLTPAELQGKHIAFSCHAVPCEDDDYFGSSLPLSLALSRSRDILLALQQNDLPLTPEHGFPVRVIVPGIAGARSVKWLDSITIQDGESQNFYMQKDYKILPVDVTDGERARDAWGRVGPLMEMPVNSVVAEVRTAGVEVEAWQDGDEDGRTEDNTVHPNEEEPDHITTVTRSADGKITISGYAIPSGAGGPITSVSLRINDGPWSEAELLPSTDEKDASGGKWAWMLWRVTLQVEKGRCTIWSRARDKSGQVQRFERSEWNLRGVAYDGFGEMDVQIL